MSIGQKYRDIINRMLDLTDNDDPADLADALRSLSASFGELAKRQNGEAARRALSKAVQPWFETDQSIFFPSHNVDDDNTEPTSPMTTGPA